MPGHEHLEIISPTGEVTFYDLDPGRGVTNIGSHPENDVIIDDGGVAPFHVVLDHRQKPYQLMLLADNSRTALRGEALTPNVATEIHHWDTIELNGHTIILLENEANNGQATQPRGRPAAMVPAQPARIQPADALTEPADEDQDVPAPRPPAVRHEARPDDVDDDVIIVESEEREWTVDVDQSVSFDVTIANGGGIVATFETTVDGLDETWVSISEPRVNLYESDRATITITVSPPRLPSSLAGNHHFAVVVTSPNHPNRRGQIGATLTVNPYHEFTIGDISPKQQTVSWRDNTGEVSLPIHNKSNTSATFQLAGEDDERTCRFEFSLPGEDVTLVRQAEVPLGPDEEVSVPIQITPTRRRLIGIRKRDHSFTITTSMLEGQTTPRTVMGQLKSKPLIGPLIIALSALVLILITIIVFRPRIYDFKANDKVLADITSQDSATLSWRGSRFAGLRIEPDVGTVDGPSGSTTVTPEENTTYMLTAENWLSGLHRGWFSDEETVRVIVTPVPPNIRVFRTDRENIVTGQSATIYWDVVDAEEVILSSDNETLSTEPVGEQIVTPEETTTYELVTRNQYDEQQRRLTIRVNEPTATPVAKPLIRRFVVTPPEITEGDRVTVEWEVEDAERVVVQECGIEEGPPVASITCQLDQTTELELIAHNGPESSGVSQSVIVNPAPTATPEPTPTPEPEAPVIDLFKLTPEEIEYGSSATLNWSVSGEYTDIEISGPPDFGINGVYPVITDTGSITVTAEETALFILRAFNGDLKAESPAELTIIPPPPTPTPAPTPVPGANIVFFRVESGGGPEDKVTQVNDTTYEVEAGSTIKFTWLVHRAEKVTLEGFGDQPFEGELETVITQSDRYQLVAKNEVDKETSAFVQINAQPKPPPPAPTDVNGTTRDENENRIEWEYSAQSKIVGFRVYRSNDLSGGRYSVVANEDDLDQGARSWLDSDGPSCGKSYYVVAVYIDIITEEIEETDPSASVWASLPCQDD